MLLQETTLALLRHPDLWVYANGEVGQVPFASADATFNRLSMAERSKLQREVTSNVGGQRYSDANVPAGDSDASSDFIAVTLLVASRNRINFKGASSADQLRESLQQLGAVGADNLLAIEVIWQPEGAGEVLSTEVLLTAYPQLQHETQTARGDSPGPLAVALWGSQTALRCRLLRWVVVRRPG